MVMADANPCCVWGRIRLIEGDCGESVLLLDLQRIMGRECLSPVVGSLGLSSRGCLARSLDLTAWPLCMVAKWENCLLCLKDLLSASRPQCDEIESREVGKRQEATKRERTIPLSPSNLSTTPLHPSTAL